MSSREDGETKVRAIDITGNRYGRLVVIKRSKLHRKMWGCKCDCGNICIIDSSHLKSGATRSCGCIRHENKGAKIIHGHSINGKMSPTYVSWRAMITRCKHSYVNGYHNYGGRGIKVCERWLNSFNAFLEDMGIRPDGKTLDRINVNGNYEPSNCKWSTLLEQAGNRQIK